ncbi:Uncharacterised protein [Vibrio cholerae]|nr:Uncharacterised protein [Vibrio cholerae]
MRILRNCSSVTQTAHTQKMRSVECLRSRTV